MSDEKEDKEKTVFSSNTKKETQDDSPQTLPFKEVRTNVKRRRKIDPTKDTSVFSANDRRLKRILENQSEENYSTMSLGDTQEVVLLIRGMVERVVMKVGTVYKLGRFEIGASADNEIDLTPYGAQDRGVSRVHAELEILDGIVHINDLGSTNGTFVNSRQLDANTPTPLRKGDELLLGRLAFQVLFR